MRKDPEIQALETYCHAERSRQVQGRIRRNRVRLLSAMSSILSMIGQGELRCVDDAVAMIAATVDEKSASRFRRELQDPRFTSRACPS
jgi:hypothetical protein